MVSLTKAQVQWTGPAGMPGVSTFYFDTGSVPDLAPVRTFFEALKTSIPNTVTIKYPPSGLIIDSITGAAVGTWAAPPPADTVCSAAGAYSSAVGAVVNWRTGTYANGREIRGKTFIVPLGSICFTGNGTLATATQTAIQNAANALRVASTTMRVWSKSTGQSAAVSSVSVPTITAVLRSRRD